MTNKSPFFGTPLLLYLHYRKRGVFYVEKNVWNMLYGCGIYSDDSGFFYFWIYRNKITGKYIHVIVVNVSGNRVSCFARIGEVGESWLENGYIR